MYGLANILGNFIASKLNFDQERREVITYGAFVLLHNLVIVLAVLLVAFIAGIFKETVIIILAFGLLRRFGGGIHVSSPIFCMVSSIIIFPLLGILAAVFSGYLLNVALFGRFIIIFLISSAALICVLFYAPREHSNHPLSTRMRARLRALSLITSLICTGLLLLGVLWGGFLKEAAAVGMALIFQAFNLLPAGGGFMEKLDRAFSHFFQKEAKSS